MLAGVRVFASLALFVPSIWGIFSAIEAGKEIRILCAQFRPGTEAGTVNRTLATGEYLRHRTQANRAGAAILIDSMYDAGNASCVVEMEQDRVLSSIYTETYRVATAGAWIAAVGIGVLSVFQLLLAAGAPFGRAAWGGRYDRLPRNLRIASLVSGVMLPFGIVCVLQRAGILGAMVRPDLAALAVEILAVLFALSLLGNAASPSRLERRIWTPVAFVLSCACFAVAFGS